jgi:AcrR family transcriptional regulator
MNKATDSRLLDVAIDHFARFGLAGASTRAIAKDAETPMSSITYHFGGKDGLYLAAAERVAERMGELLAPAIAAAMHACRLGCSRADAREAMRSVFNHLVLVLVGAETQSMARFIAREQAEPTEAFGRIYDRMMAPMLGHVAFLLKVIAGRGLGEQEARVRSMALFGQVLVFQVARETTLRGAGWKSIGATELGVVKAIVMEHLDAVLDRIAKGKKS